jgi:hypothetical protein
MVWGRGGLFTVSKPRQHLGTKGKFHPRTGTEGEERYSSTLSLTSALGGDR